MPGLTRLAVLWDAFAADQFRAAEAAARRDGLRLQSLEERDAPYLKTARALNLTFPPTFVIRADSIIQ